MIGSSLVLAALLLAPPTTGEVSERRPSCTIWVFGDERLPTPKPTAACPSWTINRADAYDPELEVSLAPEGLWPWRTQTPCWQLIHMRESFFEVLVDQAAGMLATPVAH